MTGERNKTTHYTAIVERAKEMIVNEHAYNALYEYMERIDHVHSPDGIVYASAVEGLQYIGELARVVVEMAEELTQVRVQKSWPAAVLDRNERIHELEVQLAHEKNNIDNMREALATARKLIEAYKQYQFGSDKKR